MLGCKPVETPIEQNHKLGGTIEDDMVDHDLDEENYLFISHSTRHCICCRCGKPIHAFTT